MIVVALLVSCASRRPTAGVAPTVDPALPPEPAAPVELELPCGVYREPTFGVAERRDVWVRGPEDLVVVRDGVHVSGAWWCTDEGCLLPLVAPAERIALSAGQEATVELRPLGLPEPRTLAPGETVELQPAPVAEGDPRGPIADVRIRLDRPGEVTLEVVPVHEGPGHTGAHLVSAELYGVGGREQPSVFGQFASEPGRSRNTWGLERGDWVLRVQPEGEEEWRAHCAAYQDFERPAPEWCAGPPDTGPFAVRVKFSSFEPVDAAPSEEAPPAAEPDLRLLDEVVSLPVTAEPDLVPHPVRVPRGHDVVVTWEPRDAFVSTRWTTPAGESTRYCHEHPCVHAVADFDRLELRLANAPEPRTVRVRVDALPLPEPLGELEPGYVMTLTTAVVAPDDLRGPLADVALRIPEPGEYLVGAAYDPAVGPSVGLELAAPWGGRFSPSMWNVLGEEGYAGQRYVVKEAGRYLLRVDGVGPDVPARKLEVELQRVEE